MTFSHLRRFDVQAQYAVILSIVSAIPGLFGFYLVCGRYDGQLRQIIYGAEGRFVLALGACMVASALPAAIAFVLGWSSAGQRRNDRQRRSWFGFFLGGAVLTMDAILMLAFVMLRLEVSG